MDITVNNAKVQVFRDNKFQLVKWKRIKVGEIVKVEEGQPFPADLVLLTSSEADGVAYIETSNLDGESSLKIRQACHEISQLVTYDSLKHLQAEIDCEPPNRNLTEFNGILKMNGITVSLSVIQLLLRGAKLKNTKWIYGIAVYTGNDAKLLMNTATPPLKSAKIEEMTNRRIVVLFVLLVTLSLVSALGAEIYNKYVLSDAFYLSSLLISENFAWDALTFFILYNNLIPISLQVTLEFVRFFQAYYINMDLGMYDEVTDTPANARTSNLNEELGQVKFLMTDKTGTLTRNIMKFKRCTIAGVDYGFDWKNSFEDCRLFDSIQAQSENSAGENDVREFFLIMSTCHTVVAEKKDGALNYQAASPDDGALVRAAKKQGFVFKERRPRQIIVHIKNEGDVVMELLNTLEFTSERKRMSVIVRDRDGVKLYCKGADSVIYERLSTRLNSREDVETMQEHANFYASLGYRTLWFASSKIDDNVYERWSARYKEASNALQKRQQRLAKVADEIEQDLRLIGVSAIEDRLQDLVPTTIQTLLAAEIRIWILTGDKRETAINISQSSSLCTHNTEFLILDKHTFGEVFEDMTKYLPIAQNHAQSGTPFALVIGGSSLHHALSADARTLFMGLAMSSRCVVCYRMTPMQKAEVVETIRNETNKVVLAIGDGANDVAMIQAANVGVGITGEEGLQAASSSDYSIAQFHFLRRLLLIHGLWNFDRSVKVIFYCFYKNICLYIIQLWFAFYSAFSGQAMFEKWTVALFNLAFTAWPTCVVGLFDRPIQERIILNNPKLYESVQNIVYSNFRFWLWIVISFWHSLMLFFLTLGFMKEEVVWNTGEVGGWLMFGNSAYTFVVITVCLKAIVECDTWTSVLVVFCVASVALWFVFILVYSWMWPTVPIDADMSGMAWIMCTSGTFWFALIFIPVATLLMDFVIKSLCTMLFPTKPEQAYLEEQKRRGNLSTISNASGIHAPRSLSMINTSKRLIIAMANGGSTNSSRRKRFDQ